MKDAPPLVSVVVPAYNAASYVAEAVNSVLAQTYPAVECVVVNDGSTDETGQVIDDLARRHPMLVRAVHTANRGVARARNMGILAGGGSYIAFLDADDLWLPRKLEQQMRLFHNRPDLGLVYAGLHLIDASGMFIGRMRPAPAEVALRNTLLLERPYMSLVTGVVPRHVLDIIGLFDERLSTSADCDLACRIALQYPVAPVMAPLFLWRQHGAGMHLDPRRTEHDMLLIFDKIFSDPLLPVETRRLRRRAFANLQVSLAGGHLRQRDYARFARAIARAVVAKPSRVLAGVQRLSRPGGPEGLPVDD